MKNIYLLSFFFFIFFSRSIFSQYEITDDTYDYVSVNSDIHIYTEGSDIVIQGEFLCINSHEGTYEVLITPNDDNSISFSPINEEKNTEEQNYSKLGTSEEDVISFSIILFPNPSESTLQINIEKLYVIIGIVDVFGVNQEIQKDGDILNIESYKDGIYILMIQLENGNIITKSFVKK